MSNPAKEVAEWVFRAVTSEAWDRIRERVRVERGINMQEDAGTASADGFTFSWRYSIGESALYIKCVDHPRLKPAWAIKSKLQQYVNEAKKG